MKFIIYNDTLLIVNHAARGEIVKRIETKKCKIVGHEQGENIDTVADRYYGRA